MDTQKALEWITDIFAVNGRVLTIDDTRGTTPEWDSLGSLLLLSRLEEDFGIVVSADEVAAFDSIREICDVLGRNNAFPAG
jgi:acyl carrier protein